MLLRRRNPTVLVALLPLFGPAEAGHYRTAAAVAGQSPSPDDRAALLRGIDAKRERYAGIAKEIWGFAEIGYQEQRSSALPGHGCGHNLLGTGALAAAVAVKEWLANRKPPLDYRK